MSTPLEEITDNAAAEPSPVPGTGGPAQSGQPEAQDSEASPAPQAAAQNQLHYDAQDDHDENDSTYGGSVGQSETSSLTSSIMKYREENGRTYHSYGSTEHWGPNDEEAKEQQDLSHHFWTLALGGELYSAPIKNPKNILDLGTGTGIWAIDVADMIPSAEVKGIDLSPIQPTWTPPNAKFEIDDYNLSDWGYENRFDLIHTRESLGTVPDWVDFFKKAYKALIPGGWIDCTEPCIWLKSIHHELEPDHPFVMWPVLFSEIGRKTGVTFDVAPHLKGWMEEAGLVNVTEKKMAVAVGRWPKELKQKELGLWNQLRLDFGMQDFTERKMRNELNWENSEIAVLIAKCRAAVKNSKEGLYINFHFVCGQKPETTI